MGNSDVIAQQNAGNDEQNRSSTGEHTVVNSIDMKLVRIPAGQFMMGSPGDAADTRKDETPQHRVRVTKPFHMGVYEVTQDQLAKVMGYRRSFFSPTGPGKEKVAGFSPAKLPTEQVTWHDAVKFCRKLSELPAETNAGRVYRLPTEAEWEYACRAGGTTTFNIGDKLASQQANFNGNYPFGPADKGPFLARTTPIGSFAPNAFGLFDMHGNVWEWCADWYDADYYKSSPVDDPQGPRDGSSRVIRGGSWYSDARDCRSAFRNAEIPNGIFYVMGFRVVMTMSENDEAATDTFAVTRPKSRIEATLASAEIKKTTSDSETEDWPRWRGPRGDGSWRAPKLPDNWPEGGLRQIWRQPIGGGYAGIVVSGGRVYTMDRQKEPKEVERVLCFDAATGKEIWSHDYDAKYGDLPYGNGPRSTPTVFEKRIYSLGSLGDVLCLDAVDGKVAWSKNLVNDKKRLPMWGLAASPVVFENLIIVHPGVEPKGCLIALDRKTGDEVWRSLPDAAGYATPILIQHAKVWQLVCWTAENICGLEPATGKLLWTIPFKVTYGTAIATPIFRENLVFVSGYWEGSKAIKLGAEPTDAEVIWEDKRNLRGLMSQPLYRDGHAYSLDKRHGLTCVELKTGKKLWDDENRMTPKGRNPQATMVWLGDKDRAIVLNSDGELILARLNPDGYHEQSRTKIIGTTWAHPAYVGNRVYARSDEELVCVSLVQAGE